MKTYILFIGGAGFIGSNLISRLEKEKYQITVIEPEGAYVGRLQEQEVELLYGTLNDIGFIKDTIVRFEIKIVVHLVSTLIPGSTYEDYKKEYKNVIFPSIDRY